MKLTEFLSPLTIRYAVEVSSKKRALELVGKIAAEHLNAHFPCENEHDEICPVECFSNLFKREKLGSTALNYGVAIPHAKLPQSEIALNKPLAVFLQLAEPVDYESAVHKDVDLIYALLFPEQSCEQYKVCLPEIAQKLSDKGLLKLLRSAESVDDIWQILLSADNR